MSQASLRGRVAELVQQNWSPWAIHKHLGININTANRWKRECKADESRFVNGPHRKHSGSQRMTDKEMARTMNHFEHLQPMGSEPAAEILSTKPGCKAVSGRTLRRRARRGKLHPYLGQPKPQLSAAQKRERFQFAKNHADTEFSTWAFNDQFRVPFPMRNPRTPFWARSAKQVQAWPTMKFPPTLNVHAGLTIHKTVPLIFFDGVMNSDKFTQIHDQEHIPNLVSAFRGHEFVYQHDRAPWYTSSHTQRFFAEDTPESCVALSQTEFPPCSPDINLAENQMAIVLRRVGKRKPRSIKQMRLFLQQEWLAVSKEELEHLYASMPERLRQIRAKKGGTTKY